MEFVVLLNNRILLLERLLCGIASIIAIFIFFLLTGVMNSAKVPFMQKYKDLGER